MNQLLNHHRFVFCALLLALLAGRLVDAPARGQATTPGFAQPRLEDAELDRLAADLAMQLKLTYQHNRPEYRRRLAALNEALSSWTASSRDRGDREALRRWLKRSLRASMPGARDTRLPVAPRFEVPAGVVPLVETVAKPQARSAASSAVKDVALDADASTKRDGVTAQQPTAQQPKLLINREVAARLWAESPAAAPLAWTGPVPKERAGVFDRLAVGENTSAEDDPLNAEGVNPPKPDEGLFAFEEEGSQPQSTPEFDRDPGFSENTTNEPAIQVAANKGVLSPPVKPDAAATAGSDVAVGDAAALVESLWGSSTETRNSKPGVVPSLFENGSERLLVDGGERLPLPKEGSPLKPMPELPSTAFAASPLSAAPAAVDELPLIAARAPIDDAPRITTWKPPFDMAELRQRVEQYNADLADLQESIDETVSPTAFQIDLWRRELETLGRRRQMAALYRGGLVERGFDEGAGFVSPRAVFDLLRRRIDTRRESLASLPTQAVQRELDTLAKIKEKLPEIELAHAAETARGDSEDR